MSGVDTPTHEKPGLLNRAADVCNSFVQRYLPDPFVLAAFLIVLAIIAGAIWTPHSPLGMAEIFGDGVWDLLAFAMQLSLVIVTASALASTPPVAKVVRAAARLPRSPTQATFYVTVFTALVGLINWGVAVVVGVIYAKEVARQVRGTHFPLLVAASYAGFTLWSAGLSSSIPLTMNTEGYPLEDLTGIVPLTETIFSPLNLIIVPILVITYGLVTRAMTPPADQAISLPAAALDDETARVDEVTPRTPAAKLEHSRLISLFIAVLCIGYVVWSLAQGGIDALDLNSVNLLVLGLGLTLYKGVVPYLKAAAKSASSVVPIMILYPLYSGLAAMVTASGLGELVTDWIASFATSTTLPLITFLTAGLINTVVPADGGHLVLQGPIFFSLADELGVKTGTVTMAMAIGANWSNMLQPFWALPALALARLGIRDIMGYCLVVLVVSGVVTGTLFLVLPLFL